MFSEELNPVVFTISLLCGYCLWIIIKMASGIKVFNFRTLHKITKWKNQNKSVDNYIDERLDNKQLKFFGCSQAGDALFVEFRRINGKHDGNFNLRLKDGTYLTTPVDTEHEIISSTLNGDHYCSSRGLMIERILSYTKWRITYNGLCFIRKIGQINENSDDEPQHVKFSFLWTAGSDPFSWPNNWSSKLLLCALRDVQQTDAYLDELQSFESGFDQFGSLFGQVIIENGDSKNICELNLPGVRMSRHINEKNINSFPKTHSIVAVCKDGFVLSLSARDFDNNNRIFAGCIRMPCMSVYRVDDIDLNMADIDMENIPPEMSFNIKSQKNFKLNIQIMSDSCETIQNSGFLIKQIPFVIDVNGQPGTGFIILSKKISNNYSNVDSNPLVPINYSVNNVRKSQTLTLFFNEPDAQNELLCGGKGSSLALLTHLTIEQNQGKNRFIVPQGFCLTTDAFDLQLKHNQELNKAILHIENIAYNKIKGTLEKACENASELFTGTPINDNTVIEIKRAFSILQNSSGTSFKVAVRSSAIGEDGEESSSAGQNETFLGIETIEQVLIAIQKCWASLFTVQSVTYRIQNIQSINTKMSVVIQTMVAPDCAGVLFTQHPVTNDPSKLLVTANYGLGESVVSGIVDPDMFIVQRSYRNNNLNILERKLGGKDSYIHMTSDAFVDSTKVSESLQKKLCLSDEHLLNLCEIGIYLQKIDGSPRDIEWAISKDKIYLLQSRPMTSTKSFTTWELLHEFDTAVMSDEDYFTFGNAGEVMPEAMTPLTSSVLMTAFEKALFKNFPVDENAKFFHKIMAVSHHRLEINMYTTFLRMLRREITIENRIHALTVFGHEFLTKEIHQLAVHRYGVIPKHLELWSMWLLLKKGWNGKSTVDELGRFMDQFIGTYNRRHLRNFQSINELYQDLTQKLQHEFIYVQCVHSMSTMMSSVYQMILFAAIGEGKNELTTEYLSDITILLSSCENAESAEIPMLLEKIASTLVRCNSSKAQEFCNIDPDDGIKWLSENCITAYTLFELFIQKNGHRGYQEFDFGSETWGMNPSLVIEMLQKTVRNWQPNGKNSKRPPKRSIEEIIAELKMPSKSSTRRKVKFFLPRCQTFVELREKTKSHLIAYIHELRKAYCYLAEKMQENGLLPDTNLIFFLTHHEIGTILNDRNRSDLIGKATRRRRLFPEWKKLKFAEFQWGIAKPQNNDYQNIAADAIKVVGTPVCEGKLTGRACVVKSFSEVSKIKSGDILITHGTDIAWSPYFPILGGVVTELGGLISHGAVVAREYGLPCIIGATNATEIITDGEEIYMDASAGVIWKIPNEKQ